MRATQFLQNLLHVFAILEVDATTTGFIFVDGQVNGITKLLTGTAWYNKKGQATFSDIIAFVRRSMWAKKYFNDSWFDGDYVKIKRDEWESLIDQLARAA
jgi:hypothetical protein